MNLEEFTIREAVGADAALLAALAATTFYEAYFESDDPRDLGEYIVDSFSREQMQKELNDPASTFFIGSLERGAVAYAKLREGAPDVSLKNKNSVEIHRIYLLQIVWGTGLGEILLKRCLRAAREKNYSSIWLGVWRHNPRAIRFYEKHGFQKVGELYFSYGENPETNFVMEKELK